ncbi:MAG: hypothetical protein M1833_006742 [Piccolia ochrophora]|nr:MAG: hypothetical protein M1833_006742 [Piccolia ochrophora]
MRPITFAALFSILSYLPSTFGTPAPQEPVTVAASPPGDIETVTASAPANTNPPETPAPADNDDDDDTSEPPASEPNSQFAGPKELQKPFTVDGLVVHDGLIGPSGYGTGREPPPPARYIFARIFDPSAFDEQPKNITHAWQWGSCSSKGPVPEQGPGAPDFGAVTTCDSETWTKDPSTGNLKDLTTTKNGTWTMEVTIPNGKVTNGINLDIVHTIKKSNTVYEKRARKEYGASDIDDILCWEDPGNEGVTGTACITGKTRHIFEIPITSVEEAPSDAPADVIPVPKVEAPTRDGGGD